MKGGVYRMLTVCRGACPLPYWGIFSDTEYCGSENSLISYGIFSVNTLRRVGGLSVVALPAACLPV